MNRKWSALGIAAIVMALLAVWAYAPAQFVTPTQQVNPVQINPPGNAYTLQTAFCQTSATAASANTITVAGLAGKTIYVTGFEITGSGATATSDITITLASGGTTQATYVLDVPAGVTTANANLFVEYSSPIVGLASGNNAVLTVPSFGSGNTAAAVTIHGYYQ